MGFPLWVVGSADPFSKQGRGTIPWVLMQGARDPVHTGRGQSWLIRRALRQVPKRETRRHFLLGEAGTLPRTGH